MQSSVTGLALPVLPLADAQHLRAVARITAPVQRGMGVEDLQPAAQEHQHAGHVDPMHDPHRQPVPVRGAAPLPEGGQQLRSPVEPDPPAALQAAVGVRRVRWGGGAGDEH